MVDRTARLLAVHPMGPPLERDITVGDLIEDIKREVISDLKNDPSFGIALAAAIIPHLPAAVRPT